MEDQVSGSALLQAIRFYKTQAALEEKIRRWAEPPGDTDKEKSERALRMVDLAIKNDPKLSRLSIEVFTKGSFHNRTNIQSDSDVDVGVLALKYSFNDYPTGKSAADFNLVDSEYSYEEFKGDVAKAIQNKFGYQSVTVGAKAIKVHANTVRVDADVVPHFVHRRYRNNGEPLEGVALKTPNGELIYNWPQQDYDNGVKKNERTGKRYKALVRILKNLRCDMEESGANAAKGIASYLIACLIWNVPDSTFEEPTYYGLVERALKYLIVQTSDFANVEEWGEVNELKYLFRNSQPWKLADVNLFLKAALAHLQGLAS